MGLFSNKPKVNMEKFCRDYYDSQIFHAIIDREDASQKILDVAYQSIVAADDSFAEVDRTLFETEMAAMHLEFFAFSFFRRFTNFEGAIQQSVFTRHYLREKDALYIWESMGEYNTVIARTATMNADGRRMTGESGLERMTINRVNKIRVELFDKWAKMNLQNPEKPNAQENETATCVVRVCNRFEADIMRKNEIGNRQIAAQFIYRVGGEKIWSEDQMPNMECLGKIAAQPYSMFEFASQTLKTVDMQF